MSEFLQINKLSYLHNSKNILFCKTDFLLSCFSHISRMGNDVVLITGNSDHSITEQIFNSKPPNVKAWFAQNMDFSGPGAHAIPIGLENTIECRLTNHGEVWPHAQGKHSALMNHTSKLPSKKLYANFSLNTHPERQKVYSIVKNLDYVTKNINELHSEINKKSYDAFISEIIDHEFVLCPRGNGIDSHRVWETLYLNRTPIVKKEIAMNYFNDLPIIFIDDWQEVCDLKHIYNLYSKVKSNSREKLSCKYWEDKILSCM